MRLVLGLGIVLLTMGVLYVTLTRFMREDMGAVVASQQLALAQYVASDVDQKIVERILLLRWPRAQWRRRAWQGSSETVAKCASW